MELRRTVFILGFIVVCFDIKIGVSIFFDSAQDGPTTPSSNTATSISDVTTVTEEELSNSSNSTGSSKDRLGSGFAAGDTNGVTLSLDALKQLQANLLHDYDVTLRPRLNQSKTVEVNLRFSLTSVVEFDTTGQKFSIMGYFFITWTDDVIKWNETLYGGTYNMKFPLSKIWFPPLMISKTDGGSESIGHVGVDRVTVTSEGRVTWAPDGVYNVMCKVSVRYYPFDTQTCELIFFVSDEDITSVKLTGNQQVQTDNFLENSEWRLIDVSSKTEEYLNTNMVYVEVTVERRPGFTVYTMILPLCTLAILNVFSFLIPIESGEKGGHAITLFLAYGFFITITRDSLPHNSVQVSFYVVYIAILLVLSVFTVVYVIIEYKIYATIGTRPFLLCSSFCLKTGADNKISPVVNDEEHPEKVPMDSERKFDTWTVTMGKIDIIMSVSSAIFVFFVSVVLWAIVIAGH